MDTVSADVVTVWVGLVSLSFLLVRATHQSLLEAVTGEHGAGLWGDHFDVKSDETTCFVNR